jgi:hypothetical protein
MQCNKRIMDSFPIFARYSGLSTTYFRYLSRVLFCQLSSQATLLGSQIYDEIFRTEVVLYTSTDQAPQRAYHSKQTNGNSKSPLSRSQSQKSSHCHLKIPAIHGQNATTHDNLPQATYNGNFSVGQVDAVTRCQAYPA